MTFTTTSTPSDLAFDISLYTAQDLVLAAQESKRVCGEMEKREEIRLNEIADRLFHSDDDDDDSGELILLVVQFLSRR